MRRLASLILVVCALFAFQAGAQSVWQCGADLENEEVVPPTPSDGWGGFALFTFDGCPTADSAYVDIWYQSLEGEVTGCRIHRGSRGVNGEPVLVIASEFFEEVAHCRVSIDESDCADYERSNMYVVLQTDLYPEGELRGPERVNDSETPPFAV